jgi:hypothetical protein
MALIIDSKNIDTVNTTAGRYYTRVFNGERRWYPSVTTIIGYKTSQKYAGKGYCGPAAALGSITHYQILKRYTNEILPYPSDPVWGITREEAQDRTTRCLNMWDDLNLDIKPIAVEKAVVCDHPRYAGRLDMLCELDGVLTLLDIKTGASYEPEHSLQASAYVHALDWTPKQAAFVYLDAIVGRNPSGKGSLHIYSIDDLKNAFDEFKNVYLDFGGWLEPECFPDIADRADRAE